MYMYIETVFKKRIQYLREQIICRVTHYIESRKLQYMYINIDQKLNHFRDKIIILISEQTYGLLRVTCDMNIYLNAYKPHSEYLHSIYIRIAYII